ncbi:MAG: 3-methyl-2-oxobutanoate hydroxymethyltransferase [Bacilli bacterium]|nr:3-methyl-2-oxobutanoate hydroxymethyltransferase [Bacilli bacterium]
MGEDKLTTTGFFRKKERQEKIVMVTAYDFPGAQAAAQAGVDVVLVGDSLGMVVLGYESTVLVTMEDMIHHSKAVRRGAPSAFIVADMPFLSCHLGISESVKNAGRLIQEGGADAVKIEGGRTSFAAIEAICNAQIPVVGHLGLTPQSVYQLGGYKVQSKDEQSAATTIKEARRLQEIGIFMLVMECVPAALGSFVSSDLHIPVIGIGAGQDCDGQVLVFHDLLGIKTGDLPKFAKQYQQLFPEMVTGIESYAAEVRSGAFPSKEQQYEVAGYEIQDLMKLT